jgi:hypothetical protein
VPQDFVEASRGLWRLAATQGVAEAQSHLTDLASERVYVSVCCMGCGATRKLKTCAKCKVAHFCTAESGVRAARVGRAHAALQALGGGRGKRLKVRMRTSIEG